MPTTAAAAIAWCPVSTRSTSKGLNVPPLDVITSSARPRKVKKPSSSTSATSPVRYQSPRKADFVSSRKLPVAGEQGRRAAADGEVALDPRGKLVALVVDDRDVVAGKCAAERAGLRRTVGEVRDDDVRLGLAVAVVDRQSPALLEHRDDLGVEEVAGRDETTEPRRAEALELGVRREGAVLRRRLAEDARPEPEHQIESLVGVELALVQDDLGTTRPWPDDGVPHRER